MLKYLPRIFSAQSYFYPERFRKIAQKIGGIDSNMAKAIMEKAIETNDKLKEKVFPKHLEVTCASILNNMKEGEQIPEILEPYMKVGDFICVKIIGKDLNDKYADISEDTLNILKILCNTPIKFWEKLHVISKSSIDVLQRTREKIGNKIKFNKIALDGFSRKGIGPITFSYSYEFYHTIKHLNEQFYHDMIKENEDGLTEQEKYMNQIYKKDFELMRDKLTSIGY